LQERISRAKYSLIAPNNRLHNRVLQEAPPVPLFWPRWHWLWPLIPEPDILETPMKMRRISLALVVATGMLPVALLAQQNQKPATEELPDAPTATVAALTVPNGPRAVLDTSMGRITCQFYGKQAPLAVASFIALAEGTKDWVDPVSGKKMHNKRFYDGTSFHRVIPEFMIQGGDRAGTGAGDPGFSFNDEFDPNLNFDRPGRLAMANSGPNTNGSQFFITEAAYDSLNQHYTLFGQCDDSSVDVVKTIARVNRNSDDKPDEPVLLKKVTIVREGQPLPPLPGAAKTVESNTKPAASATPAKSINK
jgi:peptidyl-prolyl cis-trans isomerase A (cyclophilin A)